MVQVATFDTKKTAAEKAYLSALCKALVLLNFRSSKQGAIKLMKLLLSRAAISVSHDKEVVRELQQMATRLKALHMSPDQELSPDLANLIFGKPLAFSSLIISCCLLFHLIVGKLAICLSNLSPGFLLST